MNKKILLVLLCLVFSPLVQAQEPLSVGFRAGFNFSNIVGGDVDKTPKSRIGFQAGFITEFYLNRSFGIQAEMLYSEQGYRDNIDINGDGMDEERQINLNYIAIPVMLKYYITNEFCVGLGPQVGVNISARSEIIDGPVGAGNEREDLDNVEFLDSAAAIGLSYVGEEGFFVQGRYLLGITPLRVDEGPDGLTLDVRHSVFQLAAGFRF